MRHEIRINRNAIRKGTERAAQAGRGVSEYVSALMLDAAFLQEAANLTDYEVRQVMQAMEEAGESATEFVYGAIDRRLEEMRFS